MQGRRLVEGFVEAHQHIEQGAEQAVQFGPLEGEAQRPEQERGDTQQLHAEQTQAMAIHFPPCRRQQKGQAVQQVDRPVRHDSPWP
ncbi:hypothetical protein D3C72_1985700 [compost metagenome]